MPAKRNAAAQQPRARKPPGERQSKLAKEHNITAREEAEIREAFSLFSEPMDGEKEGVLPIGDVRSAMVALGIPPKAGELREFTSILDPEDDGYATYEPFVAICALKYHARDQSSDAHAQELDEAFGLFTNGRGDVIHLGDLKRVAGLLKAETDDQMLKDMILEANGGAGVSAGVNREDFDVLMRRAGVWR